MGESLEVASLENRLAVRCKCGRGLGEPDKNWKEQSAVLRVGAEAAGPKCKLHEDLEMMEFLCPGCGALLSTDIKRKKDSFLFDAELDTKGFSL